MNAALPRLGLIVALASLAACRTVGPDYALPEGSAFKRPQANAAFIDTHNPEVAANQALPARWWSLYNDPVLDGLITQALRDNVELKAADAHLRRAAAVYEQAMDAGGFEYEAEAGVSRAQLSAESFLQDHELPVINLADGKFAVSYQFDLFGKLKRGAEAARADEQSVAAARDLAQVSVVAEASLRSAWRMSGRRCSSARPSPTGSGWARVGACAQSITPAGSWPGVCPSSAASE